MRTILTILILVVITLIVLWVLVFPLISGKWILGGILWGTPSLIFIFFGLIGLNVIHQEERMVVELFGRFYKIKKPGLRWVCPFIMSKRAVVSIWEQTLSLFKAPIKIDFKDGSAVPKGVTAFIKIKNPGTPYKLEGEDRPAPGVFRAIYYVNDWRMKATELLENAVRSYLATLTIDEALIEKRGGYDLLTVNRIPKSEKGKIKEALERWGLDLIRITVTDFDLDPTLVKARGDLQIRKRAADVADWEKIIRAKKTVGALIEMVAVSTGKKPEEIQKEISEDSAKEKEFIKFSQELITRQMSIDGKSLTDLRVEGGGDIRPLLTLITALKRVPATVNTEEEDKKERGNKTEKKDQNE